ncbi:hypothetical protein A2767_05135 [Candidatus Roizmanbacteria bacterium RIFCSPHIGHO2_01_FULL_35_10]|uniref:Inositol monophosphatase n=1 Tax=Candidatus Roizmanbacteria bacterium RIFCSPLOWO2_01_FULL_35_13 TaxID=1802055 RepID=A0A1F7IBG5_9BACT|nr:MAG: hypothetical protein A2767_05135 [Candidatus Roizmanbacteria bacterium RIFCSPHIGHO2_01_FULL_35_10]OGK40706.1 MAG: hypothetical protein A3A74_03755 [Candidatus Roizmanbacteria bacterium RIFCSPLOWO2_01_FULL_35_13]
MQYQNFIIESLIEAAKIARENFGKVSGTTKKEDNNQVLTETDLTIGKLLVDKVKKEYPQHNIIDEETGVVDSNSDYTWIIDPIDGTSNFAASVPTYGIMIGLLENDAPILGGIAIPNFNEIYYGEKGKGTFCNGKKIHVTEEKNLLSVLVSYGIDGQQENPEATRKESEILEEIILNSRNLRSSNSCFDVGMVAKGNYGAYLNQNQKIWDNVPEQIIIEQAGGKVTDYFGNPLSYKSPLLNFKKNYTFCAASPVLHTAIQKIIQENR